MTLELSKNKKLAEGAVYTVYGLAAVASQALDITTWANLIRSQRLQTSKASSCEGVMWASLSKQGVHTI